MRTWTYSGRMDDVCGRVETDHSTVKSWWEHRGLSPMSQLKCPRVVHERQTTDVAVHHPLILKKPTWVCGRSRWFHLRSTRFTRCGEEVCRLKEAVGPYRRLCCTRKVWTRPSVEKTPYRGIGVSHPLQTQLDTGQCRRKIGDVVEVCRVFVGRQVSWSTLSLDTPTFTLAHSPRGPVEIELVWVYEIELARFGR